MLTDDAAAFSAAFGAQAVLTPQGGQPVPVWADIEDAQPWPGLDANLGAAWSEGVARLGLARLLMSEVSEAPAWGDSLEQDGLSWRVEFARPEGSMWLVGVTSGAMQTMVEIQAKALVNDADGFKVEQWATADTLPGEAWAVSGGESSAQGTTLAETSWRIRIPAWAGLTQAHRLLVLGKSLSVTSVEDRGLRGKVMVVQAVETLSREGM